jgi:hypothetical protein
MRGFVKKVGGSECQGKNGVEEIDQTPIFTRLVPRARLSCFTFVKTRAD